MQALRLKSDYPEAHYNLGAALAQSSRPEEAIEHYEQALRLKPGYVKAHNNLGVILVQIGRPEEAIGHFKQALRLKPDYISVYNNLAEACARLRQSSEAVATAEKAMELARSQGQTALARQIEDWLNSYRASLSDRPDRAPQSKSAIPTQ